MRLKVSLLSGALVASAALGTGAASAIPGLDPGFGTNGVAPIPVSPGDADQFWSTAAAPDGGTYSVGYTTVSGTNRAFSVVKTDASGKLDPSFGDNGVAVIDVQPGPFVGGVNNPTAPPSGSAEAAAASPSRRTARSSSSVRRRRCRTPPARTPAISTSTWSV